MARYYRVDNTSDPAIMEARMFFLAAVQRKCPNVLQDLRNTVLPEYFHALSHIPNDPGVMKWKGFEQIPHKRTPELDALSQAMLGWAKRHNLHCEWVLDAAWITIVYHSGTLHCQEGPGPGEIEDFGESPEWFPINLLGLPSSLESAAPPLESARSAPPSDEAAAFDPFDKQLFVYFSLAWDPFFESWEQFMARTHQRFERSLNRHRSRIEALVRDKPAQVRVPEKRDQTHYEWAAIYRCREPIATLEKIRSEYPHVGNRSAIKHGIESVEKLIQLPPLRRTPGRRSIVEKSSTQ